MRDLFQDRTLAPRAGALTAPSPLRRAAERRCLRLAFVVVSAGAVCVRVVPCPALAPLLSAAAGVGGDGLLGRRARRRARALRCGLCSSRAVSRVFGGREHEIAERVHAAIYESASFRLRTPIDAMVASVQPSTNALASATAQVRVLSWTRLRRRSAQPESYTHRSY